MLSPIYIFRKSAGPEKHLGPGTARIERRTNLIDPE